MQIKKLVFIFLLLLNQESRTEEVFKDYLIQSSKIAKPQRGTLKGDFAELGLNALDEKSGSFMIDLPISFAAERGGMQIPFKISYSAGYGLSEYGIGFDTSLRINRFRESGKINFSDDSLMSPWGQLVKGSDDNWYSKDVSKRLKAQISNKIVTVFLPDGTVAIFGDNSNSLYTETTNSNSEVYGWYLKNTLDHSGHSTLYTYKKFQADGKTYLDKIHYGGLNQNYQYQIDFFYEKTNKDLVDFSTDKKIVKNYRVNRVNFNVLNSSNYQNRYYYNFTYTDVQNSPSFYLKAIQKIFSTGSSEPVINFTYDYPHNFLSQTSWVREPILDNLASQYKGILTNLNQTSFQDFNSDGILDFEVGKGYEQYRNINGVFSKLDLPEPSGPVSSWCLFPVYHDRKPRKYIQLHQDGTKPYVFDFFTYNSKNLLEVCLPNGERVTTIQFPYFWEYGQKTIFADIDGNGLVDVIHLRGDSYEVSYNTSERFDEGQISFSSPSAPIQINLPRTYHSFWVNDINGDGNGDLVLKGDSTIYVHYGHADGTFEKKFVTYDFYLPNGSISSKDLADSQISWVDLNKDSLLDILLQGDGFITTYINDGTGFVNTYLPGLFVNPQLYQNMAVANVTGQGNNQILSTVRVSNQNFVLKLDLDRPSLGLLTSLNDGKGNELKLEFKKANPQDGISQRKTVISRIIKKTSGKSDTTNTFQFFNIKKNSITNSFLGFKDIETSHDLMGKTIRYYDYDSQNLSKLVSTLKYDTNNLSLKNYEEYQYSTKTFQSLSFPVVSQKISGYKNNDGTQKSFVTTSYAYNDDNLCLDQETKSTSTQSLIKNISYYNLSNFSDHLSCFENEVELIGTGILAGENFNHKLEILRDDESRVVEIKKGIEEVVSEQVVTYGANGLISSLQQAGKGTFQFLYDVHYRLNKVINPDLVESNVTNFNILNDQPQNMSTSRGTITLDEQYRYDSYARLLKTWNNLGIFSEINPQSQFEYVFAKDNAPGKILIKSHVERNSGVLGESLEVLLTTGNDETLASAVEVDGSFKLQDLTEYKPNLGQTSKIRNYLIPENYDFSNMMLGDLNFSAAKISTQKNNFLSASNESTHQLQTGVTKFSTHDEIVSNGNLLKIDIVNNDSNLNTQQQINAFGNIVKFKNEENHEYKYVHDTLGRIVEITFPDNTKQTVFYNQDLGTVARVVRDNIGSFEYTYNSSTSLLTQKRRYDRLGDYKLKEDYTYDSIGRILTKTLTQINNDASDGSSTTYSYAYDGLNLPLTSRAGQEGFLTGVSSNAYSKSFIYRPDGKIIESSLIIPGFRKFKTQFTYLSHGEVASKNETVENLVTNTVETNYSLSYLYDRFGNISQIKHNGNSFAELNYNDFGQLNDIEIIGKKTAHYSYDNLTRESHEYEETHAGTTIFAQAWDYNTRGLIGSDEFKIGNRDIQKNYSYSNRGFLTGMNRSDTDGPTLNTAYSYDSVGLMSGESKDGINSTHSMNLSQWNIGGVIYNLDTLGRVVQKGNRVFDYDESGRISRVSGVGVDEASYIYDEENNPILKTYTLGKIEVVNSSIFYINDFIFEPLKIGSYTVGYLKNGIFISSSQDHLGTNVVYDQSIANLATPFGERTNRSEVNEILDFASKGFDKDLGAIRMGVRDYDPFSKKFFSTDGYYMENSQRILDNIYDSNLYGYASNNPISKIDSTGNFSEPAAGLGKNQIVIDFFIRQDSAMGFKGDNRSFEKSTPQQSRATIWIDSQTKEYRTHVSPSSLAVGGYSREPSKENKISLTDNKNGFTVNVQIRNSITNLLGPSVDAKIKFTVKGENITGHSSRDNYPALEINQWNGEDRKNLLNDNGGNSPLNLIDAYGKKSEKSF